MRRYPLSATLNTRDLGGYPVSSTNGTNFRSLIRSDLPRSLTATELSFFREMNLTTVIDLRSEQELWRTPCYFREVEGVDYHHLNLSMELEDLMRETGFSDAYWRAVREETSICTVMRTMAAAEGAVLFHCTAGKDRTGITAALLLGLAGVSHSDILADYQVSGTYIQPLIDKLQDELPDLPYYMGRSDPAYMDFCLTQLYQTYGTVTDYLAQIGLTEDELSRLRNKLLV